MQPGEKFGFEDERDMSNKEKIQYTLTFVADAVSIVLGAALTWLVFGRWFQLIPAGYNTEEEARFNLLVALAFLAAYVFFGQGEHLIQSSLGEHVWLTVRYSLSFAAILAILLLVTKNELMDSRYLFLSLVAFNFVFSFLAGMVLRHIISDPRSPYKNRIGSLVGILTTADRAEKLILDLRQDWTKRLHGVALLDAQPREVGQTIAGVPITAGYEDFMAWIRRDALDELYIDIPYETGDSLMPYLRELESMGLNIHINVPMLERLQPQDGVSWAPHMDNVLERCGGRPLVTLNGTRRNLSELMLKRAMDIAGGLVGCLISLPIILVVAVPLKLESPGPLLFKQKRVGKNGRVFNIYKLRSMYIDAEERKKELMARNEMNGLMFKIADDPRITKVGKFIRKTSIDELPQFFNVLRGDMSLVGTRPPTLDEYERYESHHKRRLSMKPGITGMWQVSGRSRIENFEDVVRLDVEYIDNWSLALDIKLLCKTILVVFTGRGAE